MKVNEAVIGGPAPRIGEHSREVLAELGYDERAIDKMVEDKAVRRGELDLIRRFACELRA